MSRQEAYVEERLRSQHENLIAELRLRERNIVFPDTVRNQGVFYRNLASKSIHAYTSHRIFAAFWGIFLLTQYSVVPAIFGPGWFAILATLIASSLWIAVALKITVNAVVHEETPRLPLPKTYPRVKI